MKLREKNTWHYNDFLYLTEQTTETFDFSADINISDWDAGLYIWEIWRDHLRKAAGKWVKRQQ